MSNKSLADQLLSGEMTVDDLLNEAIDEGLGKENRQLNEQPGFLKGLTPADVREDLRNMAKIVARMRPKSIEVGDLVTDYENLLDLIASGAKSRDVFQAVKLMTDSIDDILIKLVFV